jgi:hypothetical protein
MFGLQAKLICGAIVLALIGGLLAHDHYQTKRANREAARANQAEANYTALQEAQKHEREISQKASTDYENRLKALSVAAADTPVRTVRLCRQTDSSVSATASASSGITAPSNPGHEGESGPDPEESGSTSEDIGPALYALADKKDQELAQCLSLMGWVKSR